MSKKTEKEIEIEDKPKLKEEDFVEIKLEDIEIEDWVLKECLEGRR